MRVSETNWMQVEEYLRHDDRCVVPLGSTEQHAYLSLSVDSILSERVAAEAAAPLGVPVFPVLAYGITPYFKAYPGTLTLRVETYLAVVRDLLDGLAHSGFKRILLCNGHGGNAPAAGLAVEWISQHPDCRVRFHNWWNAPRTWAKAMEIDKIGSHASWTENFPWTRLGNVACPARRQADDRPSTRCACCRPPRCAGCWATAISAVSTSVPTRICWRYGTSRLPRRASLIEGPWA